MFHIRVPRSWDILERRITPEEVFCARRDFLRRSGVAGLGLAGVLVGCRPAPGAQWQDSDEIPGMPPRSPSSKLYPAKRNPKFARVDRKLTKESVAAHYNNFYEFSTSKEAWRYVDAFQTRPWTVEVTGLVAKPKTWDVDSLVKTIGLEERVYRFRCVEAWAMTVPWTGFRLRDLLALAEPKKEARYVRFVSAADAKTMPGILKYRSSGYRFPYYEGLSLAEASHELTFMASGVYGHELPKQHGAPLRLVVPWKYGFKSAKSIVRIELTAKRPPTFWNDLVPTEYDFTANVDPAVPHPRWSQATERLLGSGERVATLPYNGYGKEVGHLYG